MRTYPALCIMLALAMLLTPVAAVNTLDSAAGTVGAVALKPAADDAESDVIAVLASATGEVESVEMREYVIGVVAAEISPLYHTEAIKAQAVAAYTYALYVRGKNRTTENPALEGADISDSSRSYQGYYSREKRMERWGDSFKEYEKKIETAVDEVFGTVITYDGAPILAAYFELCNGKTQSAKSLWDSDIPYLKSVSSAGDKLSPAYSDSEIYTAEQFRECALNLGDLDLDGDEEDWTGKIDLNADGYVETLEIGSEKFSGAKVREAFGLKSNSFTVSYGSSGFKFKTYGSGHAVGMSQYGADYMARQGSGWEEILLHYYTGVKIEKPR